MGENPPSDCVNERRSFKKIQMQWICCCWKGKFTSQSPPALLTLLRSVSVCSARVSTTLSPALNHCARKPSVKPDRSQSEAQINCGCSFGKEKKQPFPSFLTRVRGQQGHSPLSPLISVLCFVIGSFFLGNTSSLQC